MSNDLFDGFIVIKVEFNNHLSAVFKNNAKNACIAGHLASLNTMDF